MTRLSWLFGTTTLAIAALSIGCGGDSFTAGSGGAGGQTTTTGTGGTGGNTPTGGTTAAGGATTGGGGGTGGTTGGTGGAPSCQPLAEACTECTYGACQDLYCQCYAEIDCVTLVDCLRACDPTDQACQQPCLTAHPDHISNVFLLGDCAAGPCGDACPGVQTAPPCPKCLFAECPTQMNTCLSDPECREIADCAVACNGDAICMLGCANGHPQPSVDKASALANCIVGGGPCAADCGG